MLKIGSKQRARRRAVVASLGSAESSCLLLDVTRSVVAGTELESVNAMTCHRMTFEAADCLIETEAQLIGSVPAGIARLYVLEDDGAVARPIISEDRQPLTLFASNELTAMRSAIACLADRFGAVRGPEQEYSPGASTLGVPVVFYEGKQRTPR